MGEELQGFILFKVGGKKYQGEFFRPKCTILMALIHTSVVCVFSVHDFYISAPHGSKRKKNVQSLIYLMAKFYPQVVS